MMLEVQDKIFKIQVIMIEDGCLDGAVSMF